MSNPLPDVDYRPPRLGAHRPSVGLIGCGGISRSHLRAYRGIGLAVAALCDLDPRRAERRRREYYPEAAVHADVEQLLSSGIEVVDVATRPDERVAIIEQAVAAGCHVLSQKPFATDLATARRLVALAEDRGVKLAVNQNGRWVPHWAYARRLIATGALGAVRSVSLDFHWHWTPSTEGLDERSAAGLLLLDYGIHLFDFVHCLAGDVQPRAVATVVSRERTLDGGDVPGLASTIIDFGGSQAVVSMNATAKGFFSHRTRIVAEHGVISAVRDTPRSQSVVVRTASGDYSPRLEGAWSPDGFTGAMTELLAAIEEGREPEHSGRDNLASLDLTLQAIAATSEAEPP
ncbi:MAG: Gfo/Idh/MocA family oxidoreductase [Spirochaetaceae bacterium]|nr:Gfo/Idh/MocA family oxidoreductase [Spirochaetaceae bacterium]